MENKIEELVSEINSGIGREDVSYYRLGKKLAVREYSDISEPKLSLFDSLDDCYKYLSGLARLKFNNENKKLERENIKIEFEEDLSEEENISLGFKEKESDNNVNYKLHEVWYDDEYLGLYKDTSFVGACRRALEEKGVEESKIEGLIKSIGSNRSRLSSSEIKRDYARKGSM